MADISPAAKSYSPSSTDIISHLSDHLLAEICKRLPFRSTIICKCVSKRCFDFISSPYFQTQFTIHHHSLYEALLIFIKPHELMLVFPRSSPYFGQNRVPLNVDMLLKANVCGCSNGLFLCCNNRYTTGTGYYVYNPLTKECTQIPSSPFIYKGKLYPVLYAVGFVCRPPIYYSSDEELRETTEPPPPGGSFYVLIINTFVKDRKSEFEVDVYSSETGMWKQVLVDCPEGFAFAPHWFLSFAYDGSLYFMGETGIFVYDPYTLQGYTLDYPHGADASNIMSFGFLGISCGRLRIADIGHNDLRVWELIDGDYHRPRRHWQLLHRIDLVPTKQLPQKFCANYHKKVAGFHPYDGDIVYLYSYIDGIFVADLGSDRFEAIPGYERADISPFQFIMDN